MRKKFPKRSNIMDSFNEIQSLLQDKADIQ